MRLVKLGLLSLVVISLLITLMSLLIPSTIRISRATNLPNQRNRVWTLLQNEAQWHPAYFDSASAAPMRRLNKSILQQSDSALVYTLQQAGRHPVVNGWRLYGAPTSDSLTLQWYMDFSPAWYPWEKFSTLFYEGTYGALMERGLANLKKQLHPPAEGQ